MGKQYTGSRISRDAIEDEDSDDPFAKGFDEMDNDEDSDAHEVDGGVALEVGDGGESGSDDEDDEVEIDEDMDSADSLDDKDESGDEDEEDGESDVDENDEHGSVDSGEDESEETSQVRRMMNGSSNADKVRDLMKESKSFTTTLATAAQSDVAKGEAIKTQRKTFDSLLNTRIRMQKAMIATNSMVAEAHKDEAAPDASIEAAEAAALALLNNLTDLRASLDEARTGQKRKRTPFTASTTSSAIWSSIDTSEEAALKHRKTTLEKWSAKTRGVTTTSGKGRLNVDVQQTLTDVLTAQLSNPAHLIARTQTPRSCAPLQVASKAASDPKIYDDADFYGLLLKELLEQRSADLSTNGAAEFVVQAPWQIAREAKTKKVVDTKASKGRRLRYTVHEKLQNFMAPEDRGTWGERQRDELFSSLFGQRLGLGEHDEVQSDQEEEDVDAEEQGLMLFRS